MKRRRLLTLLVKLSLMQVVLVALAMAGLMLLPQSPARALAQRQAVAVLAWVQPAPDAPERLATIARLLDVQLVYTDHTGKVLRAGNSDDGPGGPLGSAALDGETLTLRPHLFMEPPLWPLLAGMGAVLLIVFVSAALLARRLVSPIERLAGAMADLGAGALATRAGPGANDELGDLAAGFDQMAARIEQLVTAKDELLGAVAHELRTPLARLHVLLDLLAEGRFSERINVARTLQELATLERIVDDVLTLARSTGTPRMVGGMPLEVVEVGRVVAEVVSQAGGALEVHLGPGALHVLAHGRLLQRALLNLVRNALTHGRGPTPPQVRVGAGEGWVEVAVEDAGSGLTPKDQARLFEPFYRPDVARSRDDGGVGLGLTLTRRFIEEMGGTVKLDSEPGRGTTVTVRLRRAHTNARTALVSGSH